MLVDLKTILSGTREGGYAVGLFNCVTLEMTRGHHRRRGGAAFAGHHRAGESLLPGASLPDYADMMLGIARRASVQWRSLRPRLYPGAGGGGRLAGLHLRDVRLQHAAPLRRTCAASARWPKKAHAAGCSLEAEIGHVGSNGSAEEDIARSVYTRPEDALRFAQESGCDALAVAIGTAHGVYAKAPKLDLDCLGAIAAACSCPLVLHGAAAFRRSSSAHVWRAASPRSTSSPTTTSSPPAPPMPTSPSARARSS